MRVSPLAMQVSVEPGISAVKSAARGPSQAERRAYLRNDRDWLCCKLVSAPALPPGDGNSDRWPKILDASLTITPRRPVFGRVSL